MVEIDDGIGFYYKLSMERLNTLNRISGLSNCCRYVNMATSNQVVADTTICTLN